MFASPACSVHGTAMGQWTVHIAAASAASDGPGVRVHRGFVGRITG